MDIALSLLQEMKGVNLHCTIEFDVAEISKVQYTF